MAYRVEAETFTIEQGFTVKSLGPASGGQVLQAGGPGLQRATFEFDQPTGTYDMVFGYFDENDGVSSLYVSFDDPVEPWEIDSWSWDQDLGSHLANSMTATTRTIHAVPLTQGDVILVTGLKEGSEPLRIDYVDFVPSSPDLIAPVVDSVSAPDIGPAQTGTASTEITVTYSDNVALDVSSFGLDDIWVTGPGGIRLDFISHTVDIPTDGSPRSVTYTMAAPSGSWDSSDNGLYTVSLNALEVFDTSFNEAMYIDNLASFTVTTEDPPPPPASFRIEAEDFMRDLAFQVKSLAAASGNKVLQADGGGEQRASYIFDRPSGSYDLTFGYFDENDGVSSFAVFADGTEIGNWTWDQDLGSALANSMTATTRMIAGVQINQGDVIEVVGMKNGREPLRFDYVDFSGASSGPETFLYDPFGASALPDVEMEVRRGQEIALLTPVANASRYDDAVLDRIVSALDQGWMFYRQITGREPGMNPGYHIDGLSTVAVVGQSCGAGCGFLGSTGIEVWAQPFFDEWMHDSVRDRDEFDHIPFHEFGRNFWFYQGQLGALPVDAASAYAAANRYFAMDFAGVDAAPLDNSIPADAFRSSFFDDASQYYLQDPALDWSNTVLANSMPPVPGEFFDYDGSVLMSSFFARVMEDAGPSAYGQMWQTIGNAAATSDPEAASGIFLDAASSASGINYSFLRKQGGEFFVIGDAGGNQLQEPAAASGPVVMHGFAGDDHIVGGNRTTLIFGGAGNDHLEGGPKGVTFSGGPGFDVFGVSSVLNGVPGDNFCIADFMAGQDTVDMGGHAINSFFEGENSVHINFGTDEDAGAAVGDVLEVKGASDFGQITFINTAPPSAIRVEAESMDRHQGFVVSSLGGASGGQVLKAGDAGEQHASFDFGGPSGVYDVTLGYYDENDGAASLAVFVNGNEVDSFIWNQDLGSPLANSMARTTRQIENVLIHHADEIEFRGFKDGGEPLRLDFIELEFGDTLL